MAKLNVRLGVAGSLIAMAAWAMPAKAGELIDLHWASSSEIGAVNWTGIIVNPEFGYESLSLSGSGRRFLKEPEGVRAGIEVGYDKQIGNVVVGITADISKSWIDASRSNVETDLQMFGTVRGRLGYSFGRFLAFGTAGLSYGRLKIDNVDGVGGGATSSDVHTLAGWAAGGGFEYKFNNSVTVRFEYVHLDFGDEQYSSLPAGARTVSPEMDMVGIGLVSRF